MFVFLVNWVHIRYYLVIEFMQILPIQAYLKLVNVHFYAY